MRSIFELSCDLHEVVIVQLDILGTLEASSNVHTSISHTEIVGSSTIEIASDAKGLQDKGTLKACADVNDSVFGQQLHSDANYKRNR
jgi:hypothetical protein